MTHRKHKWFDLQQKFYGEFGRYRCLVDLGDGFFQQDHPFWRENIPHKLEEIRPMYQLNDVQYPAPEKDAPDCDQKYYIADPSLERLYETYTWSGDNFDFAVLSKDLIHLNPESAIQHATAMLAGKPVIEGEE